MASPDDRMYTSTHEWIMKSGNPAKAGITKYRINQIGTVTEVTMPAKNTVLTQGQTCGAGVKGENLTHDFRSPVDGSVSDRNETLLDRPGQPGHPEQVSNDPFGTGANGGWLLGIKLTDPTQRDSLMSASEYDALFS